MTQEQALHRAARRIINRYVTVAVFMPLDDEFDVIDEAATEKARQRIEDEIVSMIQEEVQQTESTE